MRLIDTTTFDFVEKTLEEATAPDGKSSYAILSHRWTDNELDYQTYMRLDKSILRAKGSPEGYSTALGKIYWASHIARQQKVPYLWIDTCCINKQDVHELNRSIRSMFLWYEKAAVCYAYLSSAPEPVEQLRKSEYAFFNTPGEEGREREPKDWFTRGWTLQELLAPRQMEFFNAEWIHIGSRSELQTQIQKAANIAPEHLHDFHTASVATKLSWAASRSTREEEDRVYSMLGVLGVSLDVRYGEGAAAAFLRLQEQIIQSNQDETIFAWTSDKLESSGMLAPSIDCFRDSGDITYNPDHRSRGSAYQLTNRGVEFPAPLWTVGGSQGEDIGFKLRGLKKQVDLVLYAWRWNPDKKKLQHISIRLARQSTSYRRTNLQFRRIECGTLGFAKKVPTTISGSVNGVQTLGATSLIHVPQTAVYKAGYEKSGAVAGPEPELYRAKIGRDG